MKYIIHYLHHPLILYLISVKEMRRIFNAIVNSFSNCYQASQFSFCRFHVAVALEFDSVNK